ncbi:FRG domain-containing protein, partial [Klebsiella pneumoniae]|nr:FRG domain-containing protein [Klebsiella pneumoniae]
MAIETIHVANATDAFERLTALALPNDTIIFRGHSDETWRLESTLARHVRTKATELSIQFMNDT